MASVFSINSKFNTKSKCYKHLEKVKWNNTPICPHCDSDRITKRKTRKFYYHCNSCNKDFTVLYGTIFEDSKLPLPKWFMLVSMMLNARKGISAKEISRHLGVTYKTAWYSAMRVRCAMIDEAPLLEGIIEVDEVYIGGKPRKRNQPGVTPDNEANLSNLTNKRGRGTKKVPVVGFVERGGQKRVITEVAGRLTTKSMLSLLRKYVNEENAIIMSDEARFYNGFDDVVQHLVIKHKERYVDGIIHTNTIEGYWSIIKNGIRGEYHVLSRKYLPFYLAEFAYKYNRRFKQDEAFSETIENAVTDESEFVNYKPKESVEKIESGKEERKIAPTKAAHILTQKMIDKKRKKTTQRKKIKKFEANLKEAKKILADIKKRKIKRAA
ncbi:MAG TPA: IS1595 family transposase [Ferruginibacter sp.]|jgi:transposase-like protein|nr:IS1595 family transposase [Ferruginibacter sp.]